MFELLIVGSGPHTLCTLLRLLEPHADSSIDGIFRKATNKARLQQVHKKQRCDTGYRQALKEWLAQHVAVVDQHGDWMCRWCRQFNSLQISHLRSSSALPVDPLDSYALVNFAEDAGREGEVQPLRSICKDRFFHGPFHTPSSALFEDHCRDCLHRYCVEGLVKQGKVVDIVPVKDTAGSITHHVAHLSDGHTITARRVLLGVGSTNLKRMPAFAADLTPVQRSGAHVRMDGGCCMTGTYPAGRMMHAWDLVETVAGCSGLLLHAHQHQAHNVHAAEEPVGAAAASAAPPSAASEAAKAGTGVAAVAEGLLTCEQQQPGTQASDCPDLNTVPSTSSSPEAAPAEPTCSDRPGAATGQPCPEHGQSPDQTEGPIAALLRAGLLQAGERVVIVGGGLTTAHLARLAAQAGASSITLLLQGPLRIKQFDVDVAYMGRLRGESLQEFRRLGGWQQRLKLMRRVLQGGSMTPEAMESLQPLMRQGLVHIEQGWQVAGADWDWQKGSWCLWNEDGVELYAERLWLATGSKVDAQAEPLLASLLAHMPVPVHGGLPAIQQSLEWAPGSGLFVLGAYAALQLGPGALNLAGAKTASVLVVNQLRKLEKGERWLQELKKLQQRHLII